MGSCVSKAKAKATLHHQQDDGSRRAPLPAAGPVDKSLLHRSTKELSLAHLTRHHRFHPFRRVDQFGLNGCYEVVRLLGRGGTGETYLCRDKRAGGELVAVKLQQRPIPKETVNMTFNECLVQATVCEGCVFTTTLREVVLTPSHFRLVLELEGSNLAEATSARVDHVGQLDLLFPEEEARFMFKQLMAGVSYLHSRHIAHRDIKLDNTLLDGHTPPTVKLCDYQFAYYWGPAGAGFRSTQHLGTPVYMSPELLQARDQREGHAYDPVAADVWASAIWLLATLVGAFPFDNAPSADTAAAEHQILQEELAEPWTRSPYVAPYLSKLSTDAVDLLSRMLEPYPERRISVSGVLHHPWYTKPLPEQLQSAWERLEGEQAAAAERVAALRVDPAMLRRRNQALHEVVEAAATDGSARSARPLRHEGEEASRVVDYASIPGGVRLDMRLRAVGAGTLAGAPLPSRPVLF